MIQIWTMQLAKWRLAQSNNIAVIDITAKSGLQCFAPHWRHLISYKNGSMTFQEYSELYIKKLRDGYVSCLEDWIALESHEKIALSCYCRADEHCHRHLFKDCLELHLTRRQVPFIFRGELTYAFKD